jgi:hypothetical protein
VIDETTESEELKEEEQKDTKFERFYKITIISKPNVS